MAPIAVVSAVKPLLAGFCSGDVLATRCQLTVEGRSPKSACEGVPTLLELN